MEVGIEGENLLLGILLLDLPGYQQFLDFAVKRLRIIIHEHPRQLLSDGACAFRFAPSDDVFVDRANDGEIIDSGVVIELIVFGGDKGKLKVGRDFVICNDNPPLNRKFADHLAVIGINRADDVGPVILQALDGGEVVFIAQQYSDCRPCCDEHSDHENKKQPEPQREFVIPRIVRSAPARCHNQRWIIAQAQRALGGMPVFPGSPRFTAPFGAHSQCVPMYSCMNGIAG
jgi:hypothetical protein